MKGNKQGLKEERTKVKINLRDMFSIISVLCDFEFIGKKKHST